MSAASSRLSRRLARTGPAESRADRMAKLLAKYDFASLRTPTRIVPDEEVLYRAIDPMALVAPLDIRDGLVVNRDELPRMRMRAYVARVWLARRLARMATHAGLAAAWLGTAREDLYRYRFYRKVLGHARGER